MPVAVMEEKKKAIARRFLGELWGEGKLDVANQILTSNFIDHDPSFPEMERGPEAYKRIVKTYRTAFPDLTVKTEDLVGEGDRIVARFTTRGTQKGDLFGIRATGKRVNLTGLVLFRITNEKISESWSHWDSLGLLTQLGVVKNPLTQ